MSRDLIAVARRVPVALAIVGCLTIVGGCHKSEPIVTYTVPTELPQQLRATPDRTLAAMLPRGNDVWFFKVTGPEASIGEIEPTLRQFVQEVQFEGDEPRLIELPSGWKRGGNRPMRFATLFIDTPQKQLDVSVSKLARQSDWDEQVKMNVNRWRRLLGLEPSNERWAAAERIDVDAADDVGAWVDLIGQASQDSSSMSPPFAGAEAGGPGGSLPANHPPVTPPSSPTEPDSDSRLRFDRPDGWRDGRMSSMRWAAFDVGDDDEQAELTVIAAAGDVRANVARWLGEIRDDKAPSEVVDEALASGLDVDVDGRGSQRFILAGAGSKAERMIDATIVPLDDGTSLFIKMMGPAATVIQQADAIESFLASLQLNPQ